MTENRAALPVKDSKYFISRELSWLNFALRVLELTASPDLPLLEKVKFAGIMGMLHDEFAMKRLGGLRNIKRRKPNKVLDGGRTPGEEIIACREELRQQSDKVGRLVESHLRPAMNQAGIALLDYENLDVEQRRYADRFYRDAVEPILTPLAVDASHPFPFISNLGLNVAVTGEGKKSGRGKFVRLKIPANRPRWVKLPAAGASSQVAVPLEQVVAANVCRFFPDWKKLKTYFFRVIRAAKDNPWERLDVDEHEQELQPGCIIGMVTAELTYRKFAGVTLLQVSEDMPENLQLWLASQLQMDPDDIIAIKGLLATADLMKFNVEGRSDLRDPPFTPTPHPRLADPAMDDPETFFQEIRAGDILVHLPYQCFDTSVLRFIRYAASDPKVLAIKLTIYRTSKDSPIMQALMEAAGRGKQVVVLVEITARFDEAPNIAWGKKLERAGVHVVYGMERLKTHVKLAMVIREEQSGIRRYVHVSTGNYNVQTAKVYEDLGILSCNRLLGENVAALFNELTGGVSSHGYDMLMVAPHNLRERFVELIHREVAHARGGRSCGIFAKMNQLQDCDMIRELYMASSAGVPIELNIRGLCCLRAGVPGLSDNIRVYSTIGRFLEHSRIYRFENGGDPEFFIGSADWMRRNLNRRMETIVPVVDSILKVQLDEILNILKKDNCSAWDMHPDGSYRRRVPAKGEEKRSAHEMFMRRATGA
ncbi:polyphosphate kinase 1 [Desulfosediminicola ganghwensis]|uniref:polyphosphate kinase 1 n=1 Tax=Desulfosediminicola ganghwensis TaxID=2569540 RepID=UPI0010AC7DC7|nr:polyphosphate kinase 1 [Desulfosediminicola ganghwensis]